MKKIKAVFLAGAVWFGGVGNALAVDTGLFAAENFSGTLAFTTDYAFRGTTFSDNGPAIQGSLDWGYGSWFVGMWGTNTVPTDDNGFGGTLEIDYYGGWANTVRGFDLMVMPLLYTFPDQNHPERDDTTFELWTSIGRGFHSILGSPYLSLAVNWSPEYFDGGADSLYIKPAISFSLPQGLGLDVAFGYQDVGGESENEYFSDDYGHIEVGLSKSFLGFDMDLRYHNNFDEEVIGEDFAYDNRVVFTISRSL